MNYLNSLSIDHIYEDRRELLLSSGELSNWPSGAPIDYLLISSKPNDYDPQQGGAVQELASIGISVEDLEKNCEMDFRPLLPCWVSKLVTGKLFKRLVVFEPEFISMQQSLNAWKAFQAIRVFTGSSNAPTMAVTLFNSSDQEFDLTVTLRMIFYAAASMAARTTVGKVNIIVPTAYAEKANNHFEVLKASYNAPPQAPESVMDTLGKITATFPETTQIPGPRAATPEEIGLTARQYKAVKDYSKITYYYLNGLLRRGDITADDFAYFHSTIEALSTGLAQLKKHQANDMIVFRGLHSFAGIDDIYKIGATVHEAAYTSTSKKDGGVFNGDYQLRIKSKIGKGIYDISEFPQEEEILFDYDMQHLAYKIDKIPIETTIVQSDEVLSNTININYIHL